MRKNNMKFLLFLSTEKGYDYLKTFYEYNNNYIGGVFSFNEINVVENYFYKIKNYCEEKNIKFFNWEIFKNDIEKIIIENKINNVILIGWRYLISDKINKLLDNKMIVYHDSILPKYRGFSPTPSMIINGEKEFGFTVLFAEKDMDCGNIIYQKKYELKDSYYIKDLIFILSKGYSNSIPYVLKNLKEKNFVKQNNENATYSCWRDIEDMHINWNKSNEYIYNFVRALGSPYKGAFCYYENEKIYIYESEIINDKINFEIEYPGKFWRINNDEAVVICKNGLIKIKNCYYENGEKVIFKKLRTRLK